MAVKTFAACAALAAMLLSSAQGAKITESRLLTADGALNAEAKRIDLVVTEDEDVTVRTETGSKTVKILDMSSRCEATKSKLENLTKEVTTRTSELDVLKKEVAARTSDTFSRDEVSQLIEKVVATTVESMLKKNIDPLARVVDASTACVEAKGLLGAKGAAACKLGKCDTPTCSKATGTYTTCGSTLNGPHASPKDGKVSTSDLKKVAHLATKCSGTKKHDRCDVKCKDGYVQSNAADAFGGPAMGTSFACSPVDGAWAWQGGAKVLKCKVGTCPKLAAGSTVQGVKAAKKTKSGLLGSLTDGETWSGTCMTGYNTVGGKAPSLVCSVSGTTAQWSVVGGCKIVDCGAWKPPNVNNEVKAGSIVAPPANTFGQRASATCASTGKTVTSICQASGKWSDIACVWYKQCNKFNGELGSDSGLKKSAKVSGVGQQQTTQNFRLAYKIKTPSNPCVRSWSGIAGGGCGAMGLWFNNGLRLERQCGPHPGHSVISCSYFKRLTNYWIIITRSQGGNGKMEVLTEDGKRVAWRDFNIGYRQYTAGVQVVGGGHVGAEYLGNNGRVYCMTFENT